MSAIKIDGMTCGACVKTIESALSGFVDPKDFAIDLDLGIAHFNDTIDTNEVLSRINNSGYSASLIDSSKQIEIPKDKEQSAFDLVPLYIILSYIYNYINSFLCPLLGTIKYHFGTNILHI